MKAAAKTTLVVIVTFPLAAILLSFVPAKNPYEAGRRAFLPTLGITILVGLLAHKEFRKRERSRSIPPPLPPQSRLRDDEKA